MEYTNGTWEARRLLADGYMIRKEGWEIRTDTWDVATWIEHGAPIRREGDAHLLAAAPDLLAACEKQQAAILALIQEWDLWEMLGALDRTLYQDALDKGQVAIAKAKGDQC